MVVFNVIAKCCGFYELMTAHLALLLSSVEENPLQLKIIGFSHHKNISIETPHHCSLKTCGYVKLFRDLISYLSEALGCTYH